jgi:hypothetical protein
MVRLFLLLNLLDVLLTTIAIDLGASEANPIIATVVDNTWAFLLTKISVSLVVLACLYLSRDAISIVSKRKGREFVGILEWENALVVINVLLFLTVIWNVFGLILIA